MRFRFIPLAAVLALIAASFRPADAAIDYSSLGAVYTQNFDDLNAADPGAPWPTSGNLTGWELYRVSVTGDPATPVLMTQYDPSDGNASDGRFYSFGTNNERALGGIGNFRFGYTGDTANNVLSGAPAGWIAASFANNTSQPLTQFTLHYDGEQWSDRWNATQTMEVQYGFGATFDTVANWTSPGASFNFTSPVNTGAGIAIDGNTAGRTANLGGTVANLNWQPGTTFWLRWVETNDIGFDHALAIDNVSFSANITAVPEAGAAAAGLAICMIIGLAKFGRSLSRHNSSLESKIVDFLRV